MKISQLKTLPTGVAVSAVGIFLCIFLSGHFFYPQAFYISHSYNLHRSGFLAFLAAIVFLQVVSQPLRERSLLRILDLAPLNPLGYIAVAFTTILVLSNSNAFALYQITTYIGILLGAAALSTLSANSLAGTITICFGLYSFLSICQLSAYSISGVQPSPSDIAYGFAHYRFFNHMQTIFIPIIIGYALSHSRTSYSRYVIFLGVMLSIALVALTAGRGTSAALVGSALIFYLIDPNKAKRYLLSLIICMAVGIAIAAALSSGWSADQMDIQLGTGLSRTSSSGRIELWLDTLRTIAAHPLTGTGAGSYFYFLSPTYRVAHPHNELLILAVEYGIPFALCAAFLVLYSLRILVLSQRIKEVSFVHSGALIGLIAAFIHSLFSGIFMTPSGQLAVLLALSICLRITSTTEQQQATAPNTKQFARTLIIGALFLITAIQFVNGTFDMLSPYCESRGVASPSPRIWLHTDSPCFQKL